MTRKPERPEAAPRGLSQKEKEKRKEKKRKKEEKSEKPWALSHGRTDPGLYNTILAKQSNPEMNLSAKGSTVAMKTMVESCSPIYRNTRKFLGAQPSILGFRAMVKLTRMGELTN